MILPPENGADGSSVAVVSMSGNGADVSAETDLTGVSYADIVFRDAPVVFHGSSPVPLTEFRHRALSPTRPRRRLQLRQYGTTPFAMHPSASSSGARSRNSRPSSNSWHSSPPGPR